MSEGGSPSPASRLAPARPRAGAVRRGGRVLPRRGARSPLGCPGAQAGAAWRARSGGGASPGSGGGATAAPPEAKFEKRTRFPPFFKPKNKTFSTISVASFSPSWLSPLPTFQGGPRSSRASRCGGGGFAIPAASRRRSPGPLSGRLAPWCGRVAAPRASRGAPQADTAMLAGTSLPPPPELACGLGPVPTPLAVAAGRRSAGRPGGVFAARLAGARLALAGAARSAADSSPFGSAPSSPPLLKRATPGGRHRRGRAARVRAGLGGLCPRKCMSAADCGLHLRAAAA